MRPGRSFLFVGAALAALLIIPGSYLVLGRPSPAADEPAQVLEKYLRAAYARDYRAAYRLISARDRRLKDEKTYVRERGPFDGFTLEVAAKLAQWIEAAPIAQEIDGDHARIKLKLRLPDANALANRLMDWDQERLNGLALSEQRALIRTLDGLRREGELPVIEGEDGFGLVKEKAGWKVFLDWAAGIRVSFDASVPPGTDIEVTPVPREVVTQSGELFTIAYRVKNRARREISARIRHHVGPAELGRHLDLVDCALIIPVTLAPGASEEYSSTYAVRGDLPDGQRQLFVTYEFEVTRR
jgi:hypothetical protein